MFQEPAFLKVLGSWVVLRSFGSPFWLVDLHVISDRFGVPKLEDANKVGYWEMWGEFS